MLNRRLAATLLVMAGIWFAPETNLSLIPGPSLTGRAYAGEEPAESHWEDEFNQIRSQVPMAMSLPMEELQKLVERCDAIRPAIEALEETPRKIYLRQLEKSKSLYLYVIETRKASNP